MTPERRINSDHNPLVSSEITHAKLAVALESASPERRSIFDQLKTKIWFQNTDEVLQVELASLPGEANNSFDGFLQDLAERPERLSNVNVISLEKIARGNYGITPIFNVENDKGDQYTYEYMSWRYGPESGAKGLVLIEDQGEVTHFIVLKGEKFATGKIETDMPGGFIDLNVDGVNTALQRVRKEIAEELGLEEITFAADLIDLGKLAIDPGMTNNRPSLFLASIDASEANKLTNSPVNPDSYELAANVIVYPINQLNEVVVECEDSFFLACVAKGWANGHIPFPARSLQD